MREWRDFKITHNDSFSRDFVRHGSGFHIVLILLKRDIWLKTSFSLHCHVFIWFSLNDKSKFSFFVSRLYYFYSNFKHYFDFKTDKYFSILNNKKSIFWINPIRLFKSQILEEYFSLILWINDVNMRSTSD